jgi:AraC-like DNA-binding protein
MKPRSRPVLFSKDGYGLPAMVTSAGVEYRRAPEPYSWHGLRRGGVEFCLFQYTLAGEGALEWEASARRLPAGSAMLVTIPHAHRYYLPAGGRWRFFYLCLNGSEILRAVRRAIALQGPVWTFEPGSDTVREAASLCRDLLRDAVRDRWETSARAYALAMALLAHAQPSSAGADAAARPPVIARALAWGREHFADPAVGVEALAEVAGLSRYHFTRQFKRSEGFPPGQWLRNERLRAAVRLLETTALPVGEVARRAGFADPNYFARAFRQRYGVSPGAFQRSGMF